MDGHGRRLGSILAALLSAAIVVALVAIQYEPSTGWDYNSFCGEDDAANGVLTALYFITIGVAVAGVVVALRLRFLWWVATLVANLTLWIASFAYWAPHCSA